MTLTTAQMIERLEVLYKKLDMEGRYVSANTIALAIDRLKELSIEFNPDALPTEIPTSLHVTK